MSNTEAAQVLAELLKHPIYVQDRDITSHERLALGKALKALRKLQSCRGGTDNG